MVDSIGKKCGRLIVPNFSACLGLYVEVLETMDLMCSSIFVPDVYDFVRWKSYLLGTNENPFFGFKRVALMSLHFFYVFPAFV